MRCVDKAVAGLPRSGVDQPPAFARGTHRAYCLLAAQKHTLGVDIHRRIPFMFGQIFDLGDGDDAGVLDRDIDSPKARGGKAI